MSTTNLEMLTLIPESDNVMLTLTPESDNVSRLFIDLIRFATFKYANWDPKNLIKAGDFGKVDKDTGKLVVAGNIYDPSTDIFRDDEADIRRLVQENPPIVEDGKHNFCAFPHGRQIVPDPAPYTGTPLSRTIFPAGRIQGHWRFGSHRGALLIMARPKSSHLPPDKILEHLAKVEAFNKPDMCLVTQVYLCPAFCFYLTNKSNDGVTLTLLRSRQYAPAETLQEMKRWSSNSDGLMISGCAPDARYDYAPLYTLQNVRKPDEFELCRCDRRPNYAGDNLWDRIESPWNFLDDNGISEPDSDYEG